MVGNVIRNQKGYMAIFIALIFQILFVFFAMVINVGLLIHDKINLQNSVDLAAYYAAGKQAEMLNMIAHSNYQIRQAWKLLAWRVRVLGDMANGDHPLLHGDPSSFNPNDLTETPVNPGRYPVVCIRHTWWENIGGQNQNFCKEELKDLAPSFPDPPPVIAAFLPINFFTASRMRDLQNNFNNECRTTGLINFVTTTNWMRAYKLDMYNRVVVIEALANALSSSPQDFRDVMGDSVSDGAEKTLKKNLTVSNSENLDFKFFNSLGHDTAKNGRFLNKIAVQPQLFYLDTKAGSGDDGCESTPRQCAEVPYHFSSDSGAQQRAQLCLEPASVSAPEHSTVGYEKNPWTIAYVGVEATVSGRRPFAPFGKPVTLRARAFAQPFGGRIGPWFRSEWPAGSPRSSAGAWVDSLLPFTRLQTGTSEDTRDRRNVVVPNYSRFPGDGLGLRSKLALSMVRQAFARDSNTKLKERVYERFGQLVPGNPTEDFLAWETGGPPNFTPAPQPPWIRDFELAAITPDLFDATYYSIEPQFYQNYVERDGGGFFSSGFAPAYDLGTRVGAPQYDKFNVIKQMRAGVPKYNGPNSFYIVKDPGNLLTGWTLNQTPDSDFDYEFPDGLFGRCMSGFKEDGRDIPSGCGVGGRTGYSVRIISEDYLKGGTSADAGNGNRGPILNPPPF